MIRQTITTDIMQATLRECWVLQTNLRCSAMNANWTTDPTWHAIVLEFIEVCEPHRRQGHCRRLIDALAADGRFDMVIVEGVGNPRLAEALMRWGWSYDHVVMDFYRWSKPVCQIMSAVRTEEPAP